MQENNPISNSPVTPVAPIPPTPIQSEPVTTQTPTPAVLPVEPQKKSPVLLIIGGILFLLIFGYLLFKQFTGTPTTPLSTVPPSPVVTPDSTADWKTYTNEKYGFSFKYPSDWKVQTGIPNTGLISLEIGDDMRFFAMFHQSYSIQEWLDNTQSGTIIGKKKVGEYTYTVIKGGSLLESLEYALDLRGNGMVRFVIEPNPDTKETEKTFDKILSTFKFTN